MADSFLILGRVTMPILVPLMLLFPIVFAALVPSRAATDSARIAVRGRLLTLSLATLVLLALWVGLLITGLRFPGVLAIANLWWAWFFPLWFALASPAVALKRPDWGSNVLGLAWPGGCSTSGGDVRSASLINRQRHSPIARWMWVIPVLVFLLAVAAIAARGLQPFPMGTDPTGAVVNQEQAVAAHAGIEPWRLTELSQAERSRWLRTLIIYGAVFLIPLLILPWSLRRMLAEPEPMAMTGSAELAALYDQQRRRRGLGLFWGLGVLLPGMMGAMLALIVWFPNQGSIWGLIGGIGGTVLGIGGAIFGTWMTVERARIAEVKARLEQASSSPR